MSAVDIGSGTDAPTSATGPLLVFDLEIEPIARFLNFEIADDPMYDGAELQYFDDAEHGTGMLAFLQRRTDRTVDFYLEPGLTIDPSGFSIAAGIGSWMTTDFDVARLEVFDDGVDAEARFTDVEKRAIEVRVDDRDGRRRRRARLLAPISASIERPDSLMLVWLHGFDLVRATATEPTIRIDGRTVSPGVLPGTRLHRRLLIKYAAPLCATHLNRNHDGPIRRVDPDAPGGVELSRDGHAVTSITAEQGNHRARFASSPALADLDALPEGATDSGRWHLEVDGARLTGGGWSVVRHGDEAQLELDVDERWKPGRLPALMRLVTIVAPVFRRWPTTYRWRASVRLGARPSMSSRWERTSLDRGESYRRATGSG